MHAMTSPKLDKAMRLLVAIEREPQSSVQLAGTLSVGRTTVVRLVDELRGLGCRIEAVREGKGDWSYHLHDWGVFEPPRVRKYVKNLSGERNGP
jgi:biotin operon repressor